MISSSSKSTRSSCNPNTFPFTDPVLSTLSPYITSTTFQPSSLNHHICGNCFRAFATVQDFVAHQSSQGRQRNEFCTRLVRMQEALRHGVLPPPESVSWETPASESSSGNKRRKVLKVIPSAELTLATGVAPDVLLEMDESDSDNLELYLKL